MESSSRIAVVVRESTVDGVELEDRGGSEGIDAGSEGMNRRWTKLSSRIAAVVRELTVDGVELEDRSGSEGIAMVVRQAEEENWEEDS
jgi:hypothetical protein